MLAVPSCAWRQPRSLKSFGISNRARHSKMEIWTFDLSSSLTWASMAIGIMVTLSILWFSRFFIAHRQPAGVPKDKLPWDKLFEVLKAQQGPGGELPEAWSNLPSDQLLQLLLQEVKRRPAAMAKSPAI